MAGSSIKTPARKIFTPGNLLFLEVGDSIKKKIDVAGSSKKKKRKRTSYLNAFFAPL